MDHDIDNFTNIPVEHSDEDWDRAEHETVDESVLTIQQRQARARIIRKNKPKIQRARELAKRKLASPEAIRKRAFIEARKLVRKRFAGKRGAEYEKLGPTEKMAIDRALDKKQALIRKIALRLIPKIKQAETRRLQSFLKGHAPMPNYGAKEGNIGEEFNRLFEETFPKLKVDTSNQPDPNKKSKPPEGVIIHGKNNTTKKPPVVESASVQRSLKRKADKSNLPFDIVEQVYRRGVEAWTEEKSVTQQQYAFARVNSFIGKGKTYFEDDRDLHEQILAMQEGKQVWDEPMPETERKGKLSLKQIRAAKQRARENDRDYPNMVDNIWASKHVDESLHETKGAEKRSHKYYDNLVKFAEKKHGKLIQAAEVELGKAAEQRKNALSKHEKAQSDLEPLKKFSADNFARKKAQELADHAESAFIEADKAHKKAISNHANAINNRKVSIDNIAKGREGTVPSNPEDYAKAIGMGSRGYGLANEEMKINGTNCKNCMWWKEETCKPVGEEELNSQGGLKAPNDEYIKMSKEVDLVTLPGKATVKEKAFCDNENVNDWVTERMCCALWDAKGVKRDYKGVSPVMEEVEVLHKKTAKGTFQLHVDEKKKTATIYKTHDKFGNKMMKPGYTGEIHKHGSPEQIRPLWNSMEEIQEQKDVNESFNIQYAAGVGVTLTAKDLGMKIQGGFAFHPSVMQEEEEVIQEDEEIVVVPPHTMVNPHTGEEEDVKGSVKRKKRRVTAR
jgi:hypothetical protein